MTKKNDKLSKAELKLMATLLEEAADEFSGNMCNDYTLPVSPENKQLLRNIVLASYHKMDQEEALQEIEDAKDELSCFENDLYTYFAQRCKKLAAK
jgi:hypothetical protein